MSASRLFKFDKSDLRYFTSALLLVTILFSLFTAMGQVVAATAGVTLSVTVESALTFSVPDTGAAAFGTLTPGTAKYATSTLIVTTNDVSGYTISLSGDNKSTGNSNLQLGGSNATIQIADQAEWIPGAATTTPGNAVLQANLASSGNVLAFRTMTASSSNGTAFLAPSWWGTSDAPANALWAGIASSSPQRTIGNAGVGSYNANPHLNTVQYYLNVSPGQAPGSYSAPITYTATGN